MAQQVITTITDDITGEAGAKTVGFGFDGQLYEIDLAEPRFTEVASSLADLAEHGRKVKATRAKSTKKRAPRGQGKKTHTEATHVRAWATANGIATPVRGRLSKDIMEAYEAAVAAGTATPFVPEEESQADQAGQADQADQTDQTDAQGEQNDSTPAGDGISTAA